MRLEILTTIVICLSFNGLVDGANVTYYNATSSMLALTQNKPIRFNIYSVNNTGEFNNRWKLFISLNNVRNASSLQLLPK